MLISHAVTPEERNKVYRLRYDVFVLEQGTTGIPTADHTAKTIVDPADDNGALITAKVDGQLVGAVRVNLLRLGSAEPFCRMIGLDGLDEEFLFATSITSRLLVTANYRSSSLPIRLAQACFQYGQPLGIRWDYILIREQLIPLYRRLGYELIGSAIQYPGVGLWSPLRLDIEAVISGKKRSIFYPKKI